MAEKPDPSLPQKHEVWRFLSKTPEIDAAFRDLIQRIKRELKKSNQTSLFYEAYRLFRWEGKRLCYDPDTKKLWFQEDWEAKVTQVAASPVAPAGFSPMSLIRGRAAAASASARPVVEEPEAGGSDLDLAGLYDRDWTKDFDLISDARYQDELRELIGRSTRRDFERDFEWVYEHFANPTIMPRNAPSVAAWGLLAICRKSPAKFFDKVLGHFQQKDRELAAERRKTQEAARSQMRLIDVLYKEFSATAIESTLLEVVSASPDQVCRVLESIGWKVTRPGNAV